jgi:hypothetical protein
VGTHRGPQEHRSRADKGPRLLEVIPYVDNLNHHFVVDPTRFDFHMMDCYRHLAEDPLAETLSLAQPTPLRSAGPGVSATAQPPRPRTVPMTPEY